MACVFNSERMQMRINLPITAKKKTTTKMNNYFMETNIV